MPQLSSSLFAGALERGEFRLEYLPIVDLGTGEVEGVEALLRWDQGTGPARLPATFLRSAEESGALVEVGHWVLRTALREVASARGETADGAVRLAVNISHGELVDRRLPRVIEEALTYTGHPADALSLEIAEGALARDTVEVGGALHRLGDLGIRLSIDDFGTGASSLSLLQSLPVDELKLDRSFVARMHDDPRSAAITRAVISLARSLELQTTAEGVELETQERMLVGLRCDTAQGWLYSRPVPTVAAAIDSVDSAAVRRRTHEGSAALWAGLRTPQAAARLAEDAFAHAPIGMSLIDGTGTYLAVNPALSDMLGVAQADLIGRSCWDDVHPDDLRAEQARLDAVLRGDLPGYSVEERYVDIAGATVWVEVTVSGLPDLSPSSSATSSAVRLLRQVRNVEDRRQAESRRLELESLNERLQEQAASLAEANERLAAFASTLSHDLQQPLVSLRGFLDLLVQHRGDQLDADAAQWLAAAHRSAGRLGEAISALRDNAHGTPGEPTAVDLHDVFAQTLVELDAQLTEAGATVDLAPLPVVVGDAAMLARVATNIISNACRYRDESRPLQISIRARHHSEDHTVIVVTDNGRGFAGDELEAIFTLGRRGAAAQERPGTGTGLAIVQSVISHLGGQVWAERRPEPGARICFTLPRHRAAADVSPAPSPARVVVIDDSEDVRAVVAAVLEAQGIEVVAEADSYHSAHPVVARTAPDAIVIDQLLGDGEGVALIPALKSHGAAIILISGAMSPLLEDHALARGADAAIAKDQLLHLGDLIRRLRPANGDQLARRTAGPAPFGTLDPADDRPAQPTMP